jgi:hypothetical protein
MPFYPIHPCCYCDKREAGLVCSIAQKVECNKFLAYLQQLHKIKAQTVLIKELKYLLSKKGGK